MRPWPVGCFAARRTADPIIPLSLFRDAAFAIPTAVSFLIGFAMFATLSYLPAFLQVGMGMSATASGGMLIALMAGLLLTTAASGALITRTGRYKLYPVAGTLLAVPGTWLFSTMDSGAAPGWCWPSMLLLGLGIGLVMQVMVLVVQNSVERRDLGAATSTVTFLRQVGASVGVAVLGSLITVRFAAAVPAPLAAALGESLKSLTPKALERLPAADRSAVGEAFGHALPPVFGYAAMVLAAAFVLTLFLPERELRTTAHADATRAPDRRQPGPANPVRTRTGPEPPTTANHEEPRMTEKTTAPLADFGAGDMAAAGGKGAALGELVRQGFPVPPGFIITTGAYLSFLAETGVGAALEGLLRVDPADGPDIGTAEGESRGAAIRALFAGTELPGALEARDRARLCGAGRRSRGGSFQCHGGGLARGRVRRPAGHVLERARRGRRGPGGRRLLGVAVDGPGRCLPPAPGDRSARAGHRRRRAENGAGRYGRSHVHRKPRHGRAR